MSTLKQFVVERDDISGSTGFTTIWISASNALHPRLISREVVPSPEVATCGARGTIRFTFEAPVGEYDLTFKTARVREPETAKVDVVHVKVV